MGEGSDYAKRNSKFIKIGDGEFVEGIFEGRKFVVKDIFGEEKEICRYKIDGKTFDSQSGQLAIAFDNIHAGTRVKITRSGDGMDTKYLVENLSNPEESPSETISPPPELTEEQQSRVDKGEPWDE